MAFRYILNSPFLKFKNNNVHLLSRYDLDNNNYQEETFFIDLDNIIPDDDLIVNNISIKYKIIMYEEDKNIVINVNLEEFYEPPFLYKVFHYVEKYITGDNYLYNDDINNIYIDPDLENIYSNKYLQI
jgi:hypothetical protein